MPLKINFWNSALRAEIKSTKPLLGLQSFCGRKATPYIPLKKKQSMEVSTILDIYKDFIENYLAIPVITGYKSDSEKFVGAKYTMTLEGLMPVEVRRSRWGHHTISVRTFQSRLG